MSDFATLLLLVIATLAVTAATQVLRWLQLNSEHRGRSACAADELEQLRAAVDDALTCLERRAREIFAELDGREASRQRQLADCLAPATAAEKAPSLAAATPLLAECAELRQRGAGAADIGRRLELPPAEAALALRLLELTAPAPADG